MLALRWRGRGGDRADLTYAALAAESDRYARALLGLGLRPGDAVGVMTGRRPETVLLALAIWKVGGVYCPLFGDLGPNPLRARLALGRIKLLVTLAETNATAVVPIRSAVPELSQVLLLGDDDGEGASALSVRLAGGGPVPSPDPRAIGIMHFTSGTTAPVTGGAAQPKAVIHDNSVAAAMTATARTALALQPGEMLWCTGEPGWAVHTAYGLVAPLATGAAILLDEAPATPTRCLSLLEDELVNVWYTTPTVIRGLMGAGAATARTCRRRGLRLAASVGEPLSPDAVEWGARALGVPFRDTWWQTETGGIVLAHDPARSPLPGSMGRPLPGMELAVVRRVGDDISFCDATGETVGELALRADTLPPWRSLGGEVGAVAENIGGWHLTRDVVRRDANGNYWFLGREDEVINLSGRMVGPFEVEAVLMSHPAVAEAGVVGAADPDQHERIVAFVAVNPGFDPVHTLREELQQYARDHLGAGLAPQDIRFEREFPRTSNGKIIRRLLKARLQSRATP